QRLCRPSPASPSCLPRGRPTLAAAARHHVGRGLDQIAQQPHVATITGPITATEALPPAPPSGRSIPSQTPLRGGPGRETWLTARCRDADVMAGSTRNLTQGTARGTRTR